MVRLVFRPYTQVRRTICTSVSLRASTRVSSGFAPLRHSSPSFGSRQVCSHSNPSQKIWVGRRCSPQGDPANQLPCAYEFTRSLTRTHVRLLGPCFKTGRMGNPQADAGSSQMPKHAERRELPTTIDATTFQGITTARAWVAAAIRVGSRQEPSGRPDHSVQHTTLTHRRPPSASLPTISSTL